MSRRQHILSLCVSVAALCTTGLCGPTNTDLVAENQPNAMELVPVLIEFRGRPGPSEQALVRSHSGRIKYTYNLVPAIAASIPEQAVTALSRNFNVVRIEPDIKVYAADGELTNAWGVEHIGAGSVHASNNRGTGVKVGIIDTGIDSTHPELSANYAGGWDFINNDNDPQDDHGHGTHVAGIVGAVDNGDVDTGVVGVAPEASLYAYKVLNASASGVYSDVIAALDQAVLDGMEVANMSLGSSEDPGQIVHDACDNAAAAGIVLVAAAGNSGKRNGSGDNIIYPARYSSVIAVAATTSSDDRAYFSSTGPDLELAAPGYNIYSTIPGGWYGYESGTSMACPHVAGTAALIIHCGISDVRGRLSSTADDLGPQGFDMLYGYGLVDDVEASTPDGPLNHPPDVAITAPVDGSSFASQASITFTGSASDPEDGDLTAALIWTSDIDGPIGTGGNFSAVLSVGSHTITASVTDSGNLQASDTSHVIVEQSANQPPVVAITAPVDGSSFASQASITFTGSASDPVDGDLTAALIWTSDIDGPIGTGGNFSAVLSVGSHTITASVIDSGNLQASDSISITVNSLPAEPTTVSVFSIDYDTQGGKRNTKHLLVTVSLGDDLGNNVVGGSVSVQVLLDGALYFSGSDISGTDGRVTFRLASAPSGYYSTIVTDVTVTGLTWDGSGSEPDSGFLKP
jgi:subtilisin